MNQSPGMGLEKGEEILVTLKTGFTLQYMEFLSDERPVSRKDHGLPKNDAHSETIDKGSASKISLKLPAT